MPGPIGTGYSNALILRILFILLILSKYIGCPSPRLLATHVPISQSWES